MASAKDYAKQLKDLGLDKFEVSVSSLDETKVALSDVRAKENQLRQIKRNINQDMKIIRAQYREKMATAGQGTAAFVGLLGKRGAAGKIRADAKRQLRSERDRVLEPYDRLKLVIDDILVQTASAKDEIGFYIEEAKAQKQAIMAKSTQARTFCTQCGQQVTKTDKFCRNCGHGL